MEENKEIENDALVENNTEVIENDNAIVNEVIEEAKEFDPSKFVSTEFVETETKTESKEEENSFTWDNTDSEVKEETKSEPIKVEEKETLQEHPTTVENSFKWEETGIEGVSNKEDFDKKIEEYKAYEKQVQEFKTQNLESETVTKLRDFLKYDDESLLKKDLELQGFKDDKLDEALDTYKYNNTINIEAQKIRNTLNKAIKVEQNKIFESQKADQAKLDAERDKSVADLKNHLNTTETMFGFKMAKEEAQLNKVRDDHFKYITSGDFLNDITDNNSNLTEAAWLWKNRKTILNAMKNKGSQLSKKELLDNIQRPETPGTTRILDPSGKTDDFNPNAFMFGE